ncbi:MAG: hypothetical protein WBX11_03890 [Thiobacillaceae bacterium]|jgi:hypothetical protein
MSTVERFDTPGEYRQALDRLLAASLRHLRIYDQNLVELALDTPQRIEALRQFCLSGSARRIEILLRDWAPVQDRQPRIMALLQQFSHVLEIRREEEINEPAMESFVIGDDRLILVRPHRDSWRSQLHLEDPLVAGAHIQNFDQLWQRAEGPLASRALGL